MTKRTETTWKKLGLEGWHSEDDHWYPVSAVTSISGEGWIYIDRGGYQPEPLSITRLRYVKPEPDGLDEALSLLLRVYPAIILASHREGAGLDTAVARELLKELGTVLGKHYGDAGIQGGPVCAGLDVPRLPDLPGELRPVAAGG